LLVESKIQDILNGVTAKPGRSRLEPYGELIDELRRRGLTYRDIAAILAEKCEFRISKSAINDFVRAQSQRKRNSAKRIAIDAKIVAPMVPKSATVASAQKPSEGEVRQRIAALKARKPAIAPSSDTFEFDPSEPLRLVRRERPGSNSGSD
jgi:hypothetical protein